MQLTRREFAAATAGGLSLFSFAARAYASPSPLAGMAAGVGGLRHIHLELPAGPYTRAALSRIVSGVAESLRLPASESASALGTAFDAETFPAEFALSVRYPQNVRLVIRATRAHSGTPQLTLRGSHGTTERSLDCGSALPLFASERSPHR